MNNKGGKNVPIPIPFTATLVSQVVESSEINLVGTNLYKCSNIICREGDKASLGSCVLISKVCVYIPLWESKSLLYSAKEKTLSLGIIKEILTTTDESPGYFTIGRDLPISTSTLVLINFLHLESEQHSILDFPKLTVTQNYGAILPKVSALQCEE